jgi:hypothetical protein
LGVINLGTDLNIPKTVLIGYRKKKRESVGFEPFYKVGPVILIEKKNENN